MTESVAAAEDKSLPSSEHDIRRQLRSQRKPGLCRLYSVETFEELNSFAMTPMAVLDGHEQSSLSKYSTDNGLSYHQQVFHRH